MRLVYEGTNQEVKNGEFIRSAGTMWEVVLFKPPHKPESSGHVTVKDTETDELREFYCHVLGMQWIEREDRIIPTERVDHPQFDALLCFIADKKLALEEIQENQPYHGDVWHDAGTQLDLIDEIQAFIKNA